MAKRYADWAPSQFDTKGLGLDEQQDWLVACVMRTRDSGPLDESNFAVVLKDLGGESDTIEVHRFGHWGPGWFEIILAHPSREAELDAWESALSDYPVASDEDFSAREQEAADETWRNCYRPHERIEYIRKHRRQFEFRSFADLMGCVRGKYFAGYASELVS